MHKSVPLLAVASLFLLAWTPLPSVVAPEVALDATPPAVSFAGPASIATDGEGAFVAVARGGSRGWDRFFYGGSLDAIGVPALDSSFIGCTDAHGRGADPAIASSGNGKGYVIVYGSAMKTYAVRFTTSGRRGETVELPAESVSDIAWDGSSFIVLTGSNAFRLSETAQVLDTKIPLAGTRAASRNGVTVAIANTGNLSTRTLTGGTVGQSVNVAPVGVTFDVAAGDPGFLVVYDAGGAVFGRLLDPSGNLDGFSFLIAAGGKSPTAVWNGTEWTVAYEVASSVRATRVLRGPVSPSFLIDESGYTPAVAANGSKVYITWRGHFGGNQSATIEGEQVTPRGPAPRGRALQTSSRIATVANAPLVVWHDGSTQLRRMDGVSPTQSIEESGTPAALASRGNEALVVLVDSKDMTLVIVDAYGVPKEIKHHTRAHGVQHAAAAWAGDSYLVVWNEWFGGAGLYMARVTVDGVMDPPKFIAPRPSLTNGIAVATAGDAALVLWNVDGSNPYTIGYLIRNAAVVKTRWLAGSTRSVAGDDQGNFLTASLQGEIVGWEGLRRDGSSSGSGQVSIGGASGRMIGAFWTGENFVLSIARRDEIAPGPARMELSAMRLTREAAAIDQTPVSFATVFTTLPASPAAMWLRNGKTLDMLYYRALDEAGLHYEWPRLVFRSVHDSPRRRTVR